jgi:hypothetical protein
MKIQLRLQARRKRTLVLKSTGTSRLRLGTREHPNHTMHGLVFTLRYVRNHWSTQHARVIWLLAPSFETFRRYYFNRTIRAKRDCIFPLLNSSSLDSHAATRTWRDNVQVLCIVYSNTNDIMTVSISLFAFDSICTPKGNVHHMPLRTRDYHAFGLIASPRPRHRRTIVAIPP